MSKTKKNKSTKTADKAAELEREAIKALRDYEAAKAQVHAAKAALKKVRKTLSDAKAAAKQARKVLKHLKKEADKVIRASSPTGKKAAKGGKAVAPKKKTPTKERAKSPKA
ncbi:hypothetical protein OPIT5_27345 [Opitutaceae bacterium TAV5]|nr:hypothetical protein OPIT5_27345 [Opitutaceae bacterium TAV5]